MAEQPIGRVLGTRDKKSQSLEFWIGISDGCYLQLDDMVWVESELPGSSEIAAQIVRFYGAVEMVTEYFEGVDFDSDTDRAAEGILPVSLAYVAHVKLTRVKPEYYIPPKPGDFVYRAKDKALSEALFVDRMKSKVPAGIMRSSDPIYLNWDFISGENGAHISISGISGVATKTSYATFLLYSILHSGVLGVEAANTKALIFNVKGEDLLFLDKKNVKLPPEDHAQYKALGLKPGAFESVQFFAPPRNPNDLVLATERRQVGILPYIWTLRQLGRDKLFSFLFAESSEDSSSLLPYIRLIESKIETIAIEQGGTDNDPVTGAQGNPMNTLFDLYDDLQFDLVEREEGAPSFWFGRFSTHSGQINAFLRRLYGVASQTRNLIRPAPPATKKQPTIDWMSKQLTVIDIHTLASGAKAFVVGAILKKFFREKEQKGASKPLVFVCLDELNKYAPREGSSPIKDTLLDIAERGRSMGIVLIGAQQTASEIEPRVYSNSSIKVVGRMDAAEADHKEYGYLGPVFKQRAKMILPGTMVVHQPNVPTPVLITFPFPAWATRPEEFDTSDEADPFNDF